MTVELEPKDRLIVALDCGATEAVQLAHALRATVRWLKVGMTLFYQEGPAIVMELQRLGYDIFLDLKLHDIPHQVSGAAHAVSGLGVQMLTVHASGGEAMMRSACEGARSGAVLTGVKPPSVIAVTVLTSMGDDGLSSIGVDRPAEAQVPLLVDLAMSSGVDGIVCSPLESAGVRASIGPNALVVTPGVRPEWSEKGDQNRITTPGDALSRGASHLVIGRPITAASSPVEAARRIIAEMEGATR